MNKTRNISKVLKAKPTLEGAGVHLKRGFGWDDVPLFDPFLMFDDFRSDRPEHFIKGFPWHPHRGIETITYVLKGDVDHGDSLGNKGVIGSGDVQWMTAGSGIVHQEMPKGNADGVMEGFQLWANLPSDRKMMDPHYRDITADRIPRVTRPDHTVIKIICGRVDGVEGPVKDIVIDPEYLDVAIPRKSEFRHPTQKGHTVFAYVMEGAGYFDQAKTRLADNGTVLLFDDGDEVCVSTESDPVRFLLISGKPLNEPVAWRGPIVMNTQEELETAFDEYQKGTFIKYKP